MYVNIPSILMVWCLHPQDFNGMVFATKAEVRGPKYQTALPPSPDSHCTVVMYGITSPH